MKMKKYLMTGIAALALCVGFTSCSHDLDVPSPEKMKEMEAQKIVNNYQKAFTATFGKVAANQTWGFGSASTRTRTENANANEWADPTKQYGGLKVPPPLTPAQIAVVKKYFQTHPKLGYEDPKWSNYFIQQVYKGHTSVPEGCATPEAYLAANGSTLIIASDHMDHLIAVDTEKGIYDHINNFNHGDCGVNNDVLTWSPDYVSVEGQTPTHPDKIMYMQNSTTKSFGYHNSDGSLYHTEYTGLVSYKTIMQVMGAEADCLEDGWKRSFMGFDFEQMVGNDVYSKILDNQHWTAPENQVEGVEYYNNFPVLGYNTWRFDADGDGVEEEYKFLASETNMYAADLKEESYKQKNGSTSTTGGKANFNDTPSDDIIRDLLSKGYLPYTDTKKDWVKVGGTADGYYSDWIVTLTEAKTEDEIDPTEYSIRVMAEDLSATESSDFDFNDVVFDVTYNTDDANATVTLKAAGGTLPLIVAVDEPADDQDYTNNEVHHLFGEATNIMINTGRSGNDGANGKTASQTISVPFSNINSEDDFLAAVKNIKIWVKKSVSNGDGTTSQKWFELDAKSGEACCKFACDPDFDWCPERTNIDKVYTFSEWVQGFSTTLVPRNNQ